jgi:hypothetical protein
MDMESSSTYRAACGFLNISSVNMTVEFRLFDYQNNLLGSAFTRTINAWTFDSFNPYVQAGAPDSSNAWVWINPLTGSGGTLFCFGATTNNLTNDPAAHVAIPLLYEAPPSSSPVKKD